METSRVLVTGGTGFVGSEIVRVLREKYPRVSIAVLDLPPEPPAKVTCCNVEYFQADVADSEAVGEVTQAAKPDVLVHTAGIVPTRAARYNQQQRRECFRVNVEGTKNVLAAAEAAGVKCFVYTSSCTVITDNVYRDHPNMGEDIPVGSAKLVYGESKVAKNPFPTILSGY